MHQTVYQNRTVVGLEDLLVDAIGRSIYLSWWSDTAGRALNIREAIEDPNAFTTMTDNIWGQIMSAMHRVSLLRKIYCHVLIVAKVSYVGEIVLKGNYELQVYLRKPTFRR